MKNDIEQSFIKDLISLIKMSESILNKTHQLVKAHYKKKPKSADIGFIKRLNSVYDKP